MDGLVKPGADFQYVCNRAKNSNYRSLVLIPGKNDKLKGPPLATYSRMERELKAFSDSKQVCETAIPPRFDVYSNDKIHYYTALPNNYIREIVSNMKTVSLIDFDFFSDISFLPTRNASQLQKKKRKLVSLIDEILKMRLINETPIKETNKLSKSE